MELQRKVGLLTLPLTDNYGGILQAAALYQCIDQLGHNVKLIQKKTFYPLWKRALIRLLERTPGQDIKKFRSRHKNQILHGEFIANYISSRTRTVVSKEELHAVSVAEQFDVVVVGSDQVWRFEYADHIYYGSYFLDFLYGLKTKRIAYAASFGVSRWKYPDKVIEISLLLDEFDAISVREDSGLNICSELGQDQAIHVLDPTLLVEFEFYKKILNCDAVVEKGKILCYVLDSSTFINHVTKTVKAALGNHAFEEHIYKKGSFHQHYTIPDWLQAFATTDVVITDSFHGMIFSIIFNKRFVVICNESRGAARFYSLLKKLNLESRLVETSMNASDVSALMATPIDYNKVNQIISEWRCVSMSFLRESLCDSR